MSGTEESHVSWSEDEIAAFADEMQDTMVSYANEQMCNRVVSLDDILIRAPDLHHYLVYRDHCWMRFPDKIRLSYARRIGANKAALASNRCIKCKEDYLVVIPTDIECKFHFMSLMHSLTCDRQDCLKKDSTVECEYCRGIHRG